MMLFYRQFLFNFVVCIQEKLNIVHKCVIVVIDFPPFQILTRNNSKGSFVVCIQEKLNIVNKCVIVVTDFPPIQILTRNNSKRVNIIKIKMRFFMFISYIT